ncbi:ComEC/Rec2 family competence protein [Candidatus Absconditicoccus praedator]|uniref:ComEC/Rec2 family competence protein n=1 Tax=Candidatus Absconditicoccus praedator TaxID=2735562 RepID=UPI001E5D8147|nr:ComEC/Rec2 family competence protein [Candidatus Absconditicoccus praedator]UFX82873.1 ComEC/Rec2 family competence protein [Candidatus Absconditicoccus praedator]
MQVVFYFVSGLLVLLLFENIFLYVGFVVVGFFLYLLFLKYFDRPVWSSLFIYVLLMGLLGVSVFLSNYLYFENLQDLDKDFFVGTGQIVDTMTDGRYVLSDRYGREFVFHSSAEYSIGDVLKTYSNYSPALVDCNICDFEWDLELVYSLDFDYDKWMFSQGYYGSIYEVNSVLLETTTAGYVQDTKKFIISSLDENISDDDQYGLSLGVLIGDRSQMDPNDYQNFLDTGLVHIVATSGTHVTFLALFLHFAFLWVPLYLRIPLIVGVVSFYSFLAGLSPNIFRAWIMGLLGLFAILFARNILVFRSMLIAFVLVLLVYPYSLLYDIGFALSFSALLGILLFQRILPDIKGFFFGVYKNYLHPTIGASIGVFPFLLFFVNQINLYTVFANFLVVPLLPIYMILSFLSIRIQFELLETMGYYLSGWFLYVAEFFASRGVYLTIHGFWSSFWIVVFFCIVFAVWYNILKTPPKQS